MARYGRCPSTWEAGLDPALACHCQYCRAEYQARTGKDLPATSKDPAERLAVYRMGTDARIEMLRDIMRAARQFVPDILNDLQLCRRLLGAFVRPSARTFRK